MHELRRLTGPDVDHLGQVQLVVRRVVAEHAVERRRGPADGRRVGRKLGDRAIRLPVRRVLKPLNSSGPAGVASMCGASSSWIASMVSGATSRSTTTQPSSASTAVDCIGVGRRRRAVCTARVAGHRPRLWHTGRTAASELRGETGAIAPVRTQHWVREEALTMDSIEMRPVGVVRGGRDGGGRRRLGWERGDDRRSMPAGSRPTWLPASTRSRISTSSTCSTSSSPDDVNLGARHPRGQDRLAEGRDLRPTGEGAAESHRRDDMRVGRRRRPRAAGPRARRDRRHPGARRQAAHGRVRAREETFASPNGRGS